MPSHAEVRNHEIEVQHTLLYQLGLVKLQELRQRGMSAAEISALMGRERADFIRASSGRQTVPNDGMSELLHARFKLTKAESRVACLLAAGFPSATVAKSLGVTIHTARRHTERVLAKLGVHSRAEVGPTILHELLDH